MKKTIVLLCLCLFSTAFLYSQNIRYEYKIKYNKEAAGITADVTITVISGNPEFTYFLTTNNPIKGEVLKKSEATKKRTYTFENVKPGVYFIKIQDDSGEQRGNSISIDENQN